MQLQFFPEISIDIGTNTVKAKAVGGGVPPLYILRSDGRAEEIAIVGFPLGLKS